MSIEFELSDLPAGFSMSNVKPKHYCWISVKEFLSSEDGNTLIERLEEISNNFLHPFFAKNIIKKSQIDNFLAIINPNRKTNFFYNELKFKIHIKPKRDLKKGEPVHKNDIADIDSLEIENIDIPSDCGIIFFFSIGWRKALFYDFSVFGGKKREINLSKLFGQFYSQLMFQELFSITPEQWIKLIEWGWFPFAWMETDDKKKLLSYSNEQEKPDSVFNELGDKFLLTLPSIIEKFKAYEGFNEHIKFITTSFERLSNKDYISCIQVLYPRIEGILRSLLLITGEKATQESMVKNLVKDKDIYSLLIPKNFQEYLKVFYFKNFDHKKDAVPLSRHTVAHGIAKSTDYDYIKSLLGFMILDQIYYYIG